MPQSRRTRTLTRAAYARTTGNFLVNDPNGFPGGYPPVSWAGVGGSGAGAGAWWMGLDSGGGAYPIGPNGPYSGQASALPVVTRATSLITGPLTAAPFREIDLADGHPLGRARWLTDPMLLRPDSRYPAAPYPAVTKLSRGEFWGEWIRSACWWGVGAFVCQEDETGQPQPGTLRLVNPLLLATERDEDSVLHWVLGAGGPAPEKAVFDRDGYLQLGPVRLRLVTLRTPHSPIDPDGHSAGVFEAHPEAFRLSGQIAAYTSGTFRSGVPNGYLKVNGATGGSMTEEQATKLKGSWMQNHGNDRRSIAVLNAFTDFVPINLSPVDAALAEVKRLSIADVAYAFGLSPETLGVTLTNSGTYQNVREAWLNHRDFGLAPWIAAVEDTLSSLLPGSQGIKVNTDGFANPPASERFATYQVALSSGVLTVDEIRALEGLGPMPAQPKPQQQQLPPPPQLRPVPGQQDQVEEKAS